MRIDILFVHHRACPVTRHHLRLLQEHHRPFPDVRIVPIAYREHAAEALPGTTFPRDLTRFRTNDASPGSAFAGRRPGNPYDLDCLVWDYVLGNTRPADKIILFEWDTLCRQNVFDFYGALLREYLVGSHLRIGSGANRRWHWYRHDRTLSADHKRTFEGHIVSLTPTCGIMIDWDLAAANASTVSANPRRFANMHNELAFGLLSSLNGVLPKSLPHAKRRMISWHPALIRLSRHGIFHPVKGRSKAGVTEVAWHLLLRAMSLARAGI